MKTIYYGATSLNGFIADSNNSLDWLFQFGGEAPDYENFIKDIGAITMGSTTYEWLFNHLVRKHPESPEPWPYQMSCWVFTTRQLPLFSNADIRFVRGDIKPVHEQMKVAAGDKNIWVVGGGELAGKFYDAGLLDELIFQVAAVTLSGGAPLFPRTMKLPLKLLNHRRFGDFVELHYSVNY